MMKFSGVVITIAACWSVGFACAEEAGKPAAIAANTGPLPAAPAPSAPQDLSDLPLTELPPTGTPTDMVGVFLTGDGGWWTLDSTVSETLAKHGVGMIGLSSFTYFKTERTPDSVTADVVRILRHYGTLWKKERFVLVGYSLGGEIMPFVTNRLPEDMRKKLVLTALIGPAKDTNFVFHVSDWVIKSQAPTYLVQPEIEAMKGVKVLCICGGDDGDCICGKVSGPQYKVIDFSGGHHFGGEFARIGEAIWKECAPGEPVKAP
jgi:type IV secretory pathway VirJ component